MLNVARFLRIVKVVLLITAAVFFAPFEALAVGCEANQIDVNGTCINSKFSIKTTNLAADTVFKFVLSAAGTFYVDWGDGTTTEVIERNGTPPQEYSHTYATAGVKTIRFAGLATEYNTTKYADKDPSGAAIRFGAGGSTVSTGTAGTPDLIKEMSGSVGSIFPTLGTGENDNQKPIFFEFCHQCTNLDSISSNLFSGVTGARHSMFRSVFDKCSSLETIPGDLFSGVSGSAPHMFRSAFYECVKLNNLPANLFAGIDGAENSMFKYAFYGTKGLVNKYIPPALFAGLHKQNATDLFQNAFQNSGILTSCPEGTIQYITGYESQWNYPNANFVPGQKVSCELNQSTLCNGATYRDGNTCVPCPTGYNYDNQSGKTSISDCKIHCEAGTWTGEYEKLEYIETTGTQYIDTGHKITNSVLSADFEISSGTNVSGNIGHFAGNQDVNNGHAANFKDSKFGLWVAFSASGTQNQGTKITTGGAFNANVRKRVHYEFNGNKRTLLVDGAGEVDKTFSGTIISNNTYRLFSNGCVGGCNDKLLQGRMHWFKLYENTDLVFDFIPVRRLSDNAIGMYDMVSGRFFANAGTGEFTAGPVIETIGGSVCENVGIGYWSEDSTTSYGSISQRNACGDDEITLTATSTKESDCHGSNDYTVCAEGTYLPANSQTCVPCTAGNWCPGGHLWYDSTDQGLFNCATEIGTGWSSEANSDAKSDCYYLITLDKNDFSGTINANFGIGCSVVGTVTGSNNAQLKVFYNTECTMPAVNLPAGNSSVYANATSWSEANDVNENVITTIQPLTETPSVTTYYARKTCAANYYKNDVNSCSACGNNSSSSIGNVAPYCTCNTGYTANGAQNGSTYSTNGCVEIDNSVLSCDAGYYLPANVSECALCLENSVCSGGLYNFNETSDQGIQSCASGTFAPTGAAVCYPHKLHVGNDVVYLRATKITTPSLNVQIGNDTFYANMTTVQTKMNKDSEHYFHVQWPDNDYYICDDTTCAQ